MRDKFIRFLKDNHAFDEFKKEILPDTFDDLNAQFKDGGAIFILNNGCFFFWKNAVTDVDWKALDEKWVGELR